MTEPVAKKAPKKPRKGSNVRIFQMVDLKDPETKKMRTVFMHECVYVQYYGFPIKPGHFIYHQDENTENNRPDNLIELPGDKGKDFHKKKNMIFQENILEQRVPFIKAYFPDIYKRLDLDKPKEEREYHRYRVRFSELFQKMKEDEKIGNNNEKLVELQIRVAKLMAEEKKLENSTKANS